MMVHIMTTGIYPPSTSKELLKIYTSSDKPKYPDFLKKIHHWAAPSPTGDFKSIAIYECPDDKLYEALKALARRYVFYTQAEGYKYTIDPLMDAEEAIKITLGK
ncbi:MAG: hypothetical protein ACFFCS_10715 [Candidatus Hodarchaeota archaeon]